MWLKDLCPELDTEKGVVCAFDFTQERLGFMDVFVEQNHPAGKLVIQVFGVYGTVSEAPNIDFADCCEEIRCMESLQCIARGIIDNVGVCTGGPSAEPLVLSELPYESKVIIAISANGTGLIQIADGRGIFIEPENVNA